MAVKEAKELSTSHRTDLSDNEEDDNYDDLEEEEVLDEESRRKRLKETASKAAKAATVLAKRKLIKPPISKYSESVLLSERGFGWLRTHPINFEHISIEEGKGRFESQADVIKGLDQVMLVWRAWSEQVCPRYKFRDVLAKTERLCRMAPLKAYWNALQRAKFDNDQAFSERLYTAQRDAEKIDPGL